MASRKSGSKQQSGGGGQSGSQGGSSQEAATKTGLFIVCYEIGGSMPGAPQFKASLAVYTPGKTVTGIGHITQAVNPPLDEATSLHGTYTYMTVMPRNVHILVTAVGYPVVNWPPGAGIGPVLLPNAELRMVLSENWQTGTASFKYQLGGNWQEVNDAPVRAVPCNTL